MLDWTQSRRLAGPRREDRHTMQHAEIVSKMTLEEKAAFVSGRGAWHTKAVPRLGVPEVELTDGPHGLRKLAPEAEGGEFTNLVHTTAFPTASLSACSFDPDLLREMGAALAEECRVHGVAMILGPGANLKRSPLCGRNFEYFSEDPLLSARMAAAWIRGVEGKGVATSLKHYAVNNQERRRMYVDAVVEDRALRELYLASFEGAVREGHPRSLMCAYNKVNGTYCSENALLNDQVLRKEWGFEGLVVTDWGACADRVRGLEAGVDLEMPESGRANPERVARAVRDGRLDEAILDRAVDRILSFVLGSAREPVEPGPSLAEDHHALARRIGRESAVLLRNVDGILPLDPAAPVAILGELARTPRYQGAGSSFLSPPRVASFLDALREGATPFSFEAAYRIDTDEPDASLEAEALALARAAAGRGEVLIVHIGLTERNESEGFDREHLRLPANQLALLEKLDGIHERVVAVYSGGAPVETPWIGTVRALLAGYLGGQAAGQSQADLVFGRANPSGKLAETWPLALEDTPAHGNFPGGERNVLYKEGLFIGYRYYASAGKPVRFPFGHGLSYSEFSWKALELSVGVASAGSAPTARVTLANVGDRPGSEVVQAYVAFPESRIERAALALAGFAKVELAAGETRTVEVPLDPAALRHWDAKLGRFAFENGEAVVRVGSSSAELPLSARFRIVGGTQPEAPVARRDLSRPFAAMSDATFETLLGRPIPPVPPARPRTTDTPFGELAEDSALIRLVLKAAVAVMAKRFGAGKDSANRRMLEAMISEMPAGKLPGLSDGALGEGVVEAFVELANRRPLRALGAFLGLPRRGDKAPGPDEPGARDAGAAGDGNRQAASVEAFIFDLDGVVVDTARLHYAAWRALANELGFDLTLEQNERLKGVSREESLAIVLSIGGVEADTARRAELAARKNAWYVESLATLSARDALPGAVAFLEAARAAGLRTALASASKNAPAILAALGIGRLFDAVVDGNAGLAAKPDPAVFLEAARRLGVPADRAVVFEDAAAGVEAALRGGFEAVGVGERTALGAARVVVPGFAGLTPRAVLKRLGRRP
ncbi:MAG: beta-phosphoglucomutase [Spirochaetales bacterium]|nr:beta-phosphoglucomutase [Spirochaetales bacterium]